MMAPTRLEMIEQCKKTDPQGKNQAIQNHIEKLTAMSDEDYVAHKAGLDAKAPAMKRAAQRMADEVLGRRPR